MALVISLGLLAGGCHLRKAPFSPLAPIAPPARTVGDALAALAVKTPPPATLKAEADFVLTVEGVKGKQSFHGNLLYRSPDSIRFRGSRSFPIGTLFDILQLGDSVRIQTEKDLFVGTTGDLIDARSQTGGFSPLEMARAAMISEFLVETLDHLPDASTLRGQPFVGDTARISFSGIPGAAPALRLREITLRREDGLVKEALFAAPVGAGGAPREAAVTYTRYGARDGRPFPEQFEIRSANPAAVLRVKMGVFLPDPKSPPMTEKTFQMDVTRLKRHPLAQLWNAPAPPS